MQIEEINLKRMIKEKARFILRGCPRCEDGALEQCWKNEYHCLQCGHVIYIDLIDTYDPRLAQFLAEKR